MFCFYESSLSEGPKLVKHMNHRLPKTTSFLFVLSLFVGVSIACFGNGVKPNILFIFADDQSYETIATLGNEEVSTPNLDRLANSGTAFTNAYNMGA